MTKTQVLNLIDHARNAVANSATGDIGNFGITFNWGTDSGHRFDGAVLEIECNDGTDVVVRIPASLADRKPTRPKAK